MSKPNIQQRVFDFFPEYPGTVTLRVLYRELPLLSESIREAVRRLKDAGLVEMIPGRGRAYRRTPGAIPPKDRRYGNANRRGRTKRRNEHERL